MNILPYILNIETKNLIINQLIEKIKLKLSKLFNKLFINFKTSRYIENILNIQKEMNDTLKEIIIEFINIIDKQFKNSDIRKQKYVINKSNVPRIIYTIYGEIYYERTLYKSKTDNKYYCFVDDILGIEKYKMYDPIIRGIVINDSVNNNPNNASYHSSLDTLNILDYLSHSKTPKISRQSIYRWIREFNIKDIKYETINNKSTLYVMADEKWIHKQEKQNKGKKKWIMSKCFVVFTGIKRKKGRTKLIGKHTFITASSCAYKDLMNEICKIYDFEKIKIINLLSDSGSWIINGKDELRIYSHNSVVINTCEFHVKQKINRSTIDKDLREKLSKAIYEDEDKNTFIKIMDEIIKSKNSQARKDKITEYKNYIIKHWSGIIAMKYCDIKSSMEAHISHCVASKFGSRPKAYSDKFIQTYLKLQEASLNGINILDYYLKSYNSVDDYTYNEKEVEFSMFDYSTSNLPVCSTYNPRSFLLHSIAYPDDNLFNIR